MTALSIAMTWIALLALSPDPSTTTAPAAGVWLVTGDGELMLRPFKAAPYPHASRSQGYQAKADFFAADPHYRDSTVGIFIPAGFKSGETVDFVVHFHGHRNHVAQVFEQFDLSGEMRKSGRNAMLIVPQGPKDAPDSGCGKLEHDPGSLQALLNEVIEFLTSEQRITTKRIGRVVLSAHSGGYQVAGAILARGELREQITDLLLFDATYGQLEAFASFCKRDKKRRLVSIFTDHLAPENFDLITMLQESDVGFRAIMEAELTDDLLKDRRPLLVHTLDLAHNDVVSKRNYFARFLETADLNAVAGR